MGVSGQRHAPAALPPGKGPPVPIGQEAGWASEPVWTQGLEEKFSAPVGDRTSIFVCVSYLKSCVSLAFGVGPRRILRIIQRFGKHCSSHLQGEYVLVGRFWKPYIGQACQVYLGQKP
jgi:hypothetical protein